MKRCTTCNRTFTDPNLSFCIDDGTPLTTIPDDETTVVSPAYRPPSGYVPPGTNVRKRRAWPWVVGILGAFVLGIVTISIAAAVLVPRWMRRAEELQRGAPPPRQAERPANSNQSENTESITEDDKPTENVDVPPPSDSEQVLAQLKDLEHEWTVANLNADKKALNRILADDYVGPTADGKDQGKAEYIQTIERDTQVDKWEFADLKVSLSGDRATLTGNITYFVDDREVVFDFTDKFVWRNGRWQATGSQVSRRE